MDEEDRLPSSHGQYDASKKGTLVVSIKMYTCCGTVYSYSYTVEPLNKGHLGTQAAVPYSEVVPYWEVRDKTVIL